MQQGTAAPTLGAILKANQAEEIRRQDEKERKVREKEEAAARARHIAVQRLAKDAIEVITHQIEQGKTSDLGVDVGEKQSTVHHKAAYDALKLGSSTKIAEDPSGEYAADLQSLHDWAAANDLRVVWTYQHDGMGTASWYRLTVEAL